MAVREQPPEEGVARALTDLGEQARKLVDKEIEGAEHEMLDKVKSWTPATALLLVAGVSGLAAGASLYRYSVQLLQKALPPATASLLAALGYGSLASFCALSALQRIKDLPPPVPSETIATAASAVETAVS